jgi:hypothetical protein
LLYPARRKLDRRMYIGVGRFRSDLAGWRTAHLNAALCGGAAGQELDRYSSDPLPELNKEASKAPFHMGQ